MTATIDFINQKYGYQLTWADGQASGTCFSRSHRPEMIDRLKRGVEGALKRQRIFGPSMFVWQNQAQQSVNDFRTNKGLRRRGGAGRYLGTDIKFGAEWNEALTDALFDVSLTTWVPGTGEVRTEFKALQFPTLETCVEFLDLFLDTETNTYTHTIYLEAYWLEDSTLPVMQNVFAWNAFFGALSAGVKRFTTVDPEALTNPSTPPNWLETILLDLWNSIHASPPVYATLEELCSLFWMHGRSKGANRYKAAHTAGWVANGRGVADSAAGWVVRPTVPGEECNGEGSPLSVRQLNFNGQSVVAANHRDWLKQAPDADPVSQILYGAIQGPAPATTLKAVGIHPMGADCIQVPWTDPALYNLQAVCEPRVGTSALAREIPEPCFNGVWNTQAHSRVITAAEWGWVYRSNPDGIGSGRHQARLRWRKKGTPLVGPLSRTMIKDMRTLSSPYTEGRASLPHAYLIE